MGRGCTVEAGREDSGLAWDSCDTGRWIHPARAAEGLGEGGNLGTAGAGLVQPSGQGGQCLRQGGDVETWQVCCGQGESGVTVDIRVESQGGGSGPQAGRDGGGGGGARLPRTGAEREEGAQTPVLKAMWE